MKTEIEVKFLDINFDMLRERLVALGGMCEQPMRLMRRAIIQNEVRGGIITFACVTRVTR